MTDYWKQPYPVKRGSVDAKGIIVPPAPALTPRSPEQVGSTPTGERSPETGVQAGSTPARGTNDVGLLYVPETPKETVIRYEVAALTPAPDGWRWDVLPIGDMYDRVCPPQATRYFQLKPFCAFQGKILHIEHEDGLFIQGIKVGTRLVSCGYEGDPPVSTFDPAKQLDFPTAQIGNIITIEIFNSTDVEKTLRGAILGFAFHGCASP